MPISLSQIPHELALDRTNASAVTGLRSHGITIYRITRTDDVI